VQQATEPPGIKFPELSPLLSLCTTYGLGGESAVLPETEWNASNFANLVAFRMCGNALAAVPRATVPEPWRSQLMSSVGAEVTHGRGLLGRAVDFQELLSSAGIRSLAVKGLAVADLHPTSVPRRFADVDLLVPQGQYLQAISFLHRKGYRPLTRPWSDKQIARMMPSVNFEAADGRQLDLQRYLGSWALGRRVDFDEAYERARTITIGDRQLKATGLPDTMITTALSMLADYGTGYEKLWPWRDLVVLSEQASPDEVAEICERTELSWVLHDVLLALPEGARPDELVARLARRPPSRADQLRRRMLLETPPRWRRAFGHMMRLPPLGGAEFFIDLVRQHFEKIDRTPRPPSP